MKTRITSIILTFLIIIGSIMPFSAFAAETKRLDEEFYQKSQAALVAFGILDEEQVSFTDEVSRFDFVDTILDVFEKAGINYTSGSAHFFDIEDGTMLSERLCSAVGARLIHGDNGAFRPNDIITLNEALTITMNALGYNEIKSYMTYGEYISRAIKLGLSDGIYALDEKMSIGDMYALIYNMLDCSMLEISSIGTQSYNPAVQYSKDGKTFAETYFGIMHVEGIMTANSTAIIVKDDKQKNKCTVLTENGEMRFTTNNSLYEKYLGYAVDMFYTDDNGKNTVVFVAKHSDNNETVIEGVNVYEYEISARKLKYYEVQTESVIKSNKKERSVSIPVGVNIMYNSCYVSDNKEVFDRINNAVDGNGELNIRNVILLDNNSDGQIDIMFVNMYENFFVEKITKDGYVTDCYTNGTLDTQDSKITMNIYDENGELSDYTCIKSDDVISIERDLKEEILTTVYVTRKTLTDTLQGINKSMGKQEFLLSGTESEVANGKAGDMIRTNCKISNSYTFYYDVCGNIAAMRENTNQIPYAYILGVAKSKGLQSETILKAAVPDDSEYGVTIHEYTVKENFTADGVNSKSSTYDFDSLKYKLIRFQKNNADKIISINTPAATKGAGQFSYMYEKEFMGSIKTTYRPNWKMFIEESGTLDEYKSCNFTVDADTIIFSVPGSDNIENYEARISRIENSKLGNYFNDWRQYNVHGYVNDENSLICDVLIVQFEDGMSSAQEKAFNKTRTFLIDKVGRAINNNDKETILIEGMERKERISYTTSDNVVYDYDTGKEITLHPGDIIQCFPDGYGDIKYIRRIYNYESDSYGAIPYKISTSSDPRVVIGKPFKTDNTAFSMTEKNKPETMEYAEVFVCGGDHYVYVYDKENEKATLGSWKDITAEDNARVVIWCATSTYLDIIVYR